MGLHTLAAEAVSSEPTILRRTVAREAGRVAAGARVTAGRLSLAARLVVVLWEVETGARGVREGLPPQERLDGVLPSEATPPLLRAGTSREIGGTPSEDEATITLPYTGLQVTPRVREVSPRYGRARLLGPRVVPSGGLFDIATPGVVPASLL